MSNNFPASGPTRQEVNKSTDPVCEENDEDPNDLVISFGRFVHGTVDQHPDPEDRPSNAKNAKSERLAVQ